MGNLSQERKKLSCKSCPKSSARDTRVPHRKLTKKVSFVLYCVGNISLTRNFQTCIKQITHQSLLSTSKNQQNTARAMKRLRTFEPFPALLLLLQLLQEGSLPTSTNKSPAQEDRGIGWTQSTGTCGQYARPPVLVGIEAWRGVEFNFFSNSLYTASQHLSNLCHLEKHSLCLAERRNDGAEHGFPHPGLTLETPKELLQILQWKYTVFLGRR